MRGGDEASESSRGRDDGGGGGDGTRASRTKEPRWTKTLPDVLHEVRSTERRGVDG